MPWDEFNSGNCGVDGAGRAAESGSSPGVSVLKATVLGLAGVQFSAFSEGRKKSVVMGLRFEFDRGNQVLLARIEGRLTDELLAEAMREIRKHSIATDARAGIFDFSLVSEVAVSSAFVRELAKQEPAMVDAARRPRFLVAPAGVTFGLARMFQMLGESTRPLLEVVHTMDEALAALGVRSPRFEPLE
jgi:hypothetical protein